ncbi:hypothetical protein [Nocardia pseudovaccinii]|uniref:hypothetical protein n=1 Tax=Nocardia pseudovaccinii TaxID=189540 RepID=UPI0007A3A7E7|nr:hypothetical protein [Nocardia pseudovaccinii]
MPRITGHYRGTERATGKHVAAEFAHIWHNAEKLFALHQYTDTQHWREALSDAARTRPDSGRPGG